MATEEGNGDRRFVSLYHGVVTNDEDPYRLGRVKVRVAGLLEPESRWAFPLGTLGGGSKEVGFYSVPKVGSEVGLWCCQGDPDFVFYVSGHWGRPRGVPDSPSFVNAPGVSDADATKLRGFETERFVFLFDNRPGKESFEIRDKVSGDGIGYDSLTRAMQIKATTAVVIEATGAVDIKGAAITIAGRPVTPGTGPI